MDVMIVGGLIRALQGLAAASPTLIVGLFVATLLRYYLGTEGTLRLFGGNGLRSLPQSWLVGMLLPVCSIGVIPIIREMRRMGMRPGSITAFALSAPLFNPLSLLYGLTLSRPYVIVGFAFGSLAVVTILGVIWDRSTAWKPHESQPESNPIGLRRLGLCAVYMARELCGPTGLLALVAVAGLVVLAVLLPHGALQSSVEQLDPLAPLKMALVSILIYATPMLTMSQLGMMFAHGNSPGAAFCLLLLGTGVNLATLWWIASNYGRKPTLVWFSVLFVVVLSCAYAIDRPLIPPGIEPAGHTHAFDVYTNPLHSGSSIGWDRISGELGKTVGLFDWIALGCLGAILLSGILSQTFVRRWLDATDSSDALSVSSIESLTAAKGWDRVVSPRIVGFTCLAGLVAFSVVACYAYYPAPSEVLEEMRLARVEVLSGASSRDFERTLHWIPILEEWSRKLEVGSAMRCFELRPYQQMQAHLLRKKLELLEHATEHAAEATVKLQVGQPQEPDSHRGSPHIDLAQELSEMDALRTEISVNASRLANAFK